MSVRDVLRKSRASVHVCEISSGPVFVKAFSGAGRQIYADLSRSSDGLLPLHTIAALALCEEDGSMLFDLTTEKGVALAKLELEEMDGMDLQKIVLKLFEVSGLSKDSVEQSEKKSEASQNA